jgi:hypothetical protein
MRGLIDSFVMGSIFENAAWPPDVRKAYGFPESFTQSFEAAPRS